MIADPRSASADVSLPRTPLLPTDVRLTVLVAVLCAGIYLPTMGSYGMFDPWETHYTEVARQFMERGDWLSTWWQNGTGPDGLSESHFWSKPVGSFWLSGLSLKLFGYAEDITLRGALPRGIDPGEVITTSAIEWAVRLPFVLCGLFGILGIYLFCARLFSRRAGLLAALILASSPMYFFISRQAMTDMPYVGLMSGGLGFFGLAVFGARQPYRSRRLRDAPGLYLFFGFFALLMGLQLAAIVPPLLSASAGVRVFGAEISQAVWMMPYAALALVFIFLVARTQTRNEVYLYLFYAAAAGAALSKGLLGGLLPGMIILCYLVVSREWRLLTQVALGRGLLLAVCVCFPWYHAMLVHHGPRWWNTLFGSEQLRRLTIGEQKQATGSFEYYLAQLGYGFFPWVALLPAALFSPRAPAEADAASSGQRRARRFVILWLIAPWALFTIASTKYHHYILPCLPPAAILVALFIDNLLAQRIRVRPLTAGLVVALVVLALVSLDLIRQPAHWVWMFTYLYTATWAKGAPAGTLFVAYSIACAIPLILLFIPRLRRVAIWALIAIGTLWGGYTLSRYQLAVAPHWSQKAVLQTYYARRASPQEKLIAWQFNWRGETWHTAAQVVVAKSLDNKAIAAWLNARTGRRFFFITERRRYPALRAMLPTPRGKETLKVEDDSNVHYILASAEI